VDTSENSQAAHGIRRISSILLRVQQTRPLGKLSRYFQRTLLILQDRIWDVENKRKQKSVIVVKSKERGTRTKVSTCAYSTDGTIIGGGGSYEALVDHMVYIMIDPACLDGALHMWQASSNFVRPNMTIEGAHTKGTEAGSVVFSVDGRTVLTRGGDDSVKRTYKCYLCHVLG